MPASNILDVPNFFWDSEPTLHPLYVAIREYLEIDPRIKVLNERCRVFLDLAEILSDSVADAKMSSITWIIIVLIALSIIITVTEVTLRFGILEKHKNSGRALLTDMDVVAPDPFRLELRHLASMNVTAEDLRRWSALWTREQREGVCGSAIIGTIGPGI
jgi:hypothetical protein